MSASKINGGELAEKTGSGVVGMTLSALQGRQADEVGVFGFERGVYVCWHRWQIGENRCRRPIAGIKCGCLPRDSSLSEAVEKQSLVVVLLNSCNHVVSSDELATGWGGPAG
jgi:hypothetical protein